MRSMFLQLNCTIPALTFSFSFFFFPSLPKGFLSKLSMAESLIYWQSEASAFLFPYLLFPHAWDRLRATEGQVSPLLPLLLLGLTSNQDEGFTLHPEGCGGGMCCDIPNCPKGNVCQYMPKGKTNYVNKGKKKCYFWIHSKINLYCTKLVYGDCWGICSSL